MIEACKLVVDHVEGHRRGQRQVFSLPGSVSFGRHPSSDVAFDARADIDASSHHAQLLVEGEAVTLSDVGSSNGTFLNGEQIQNVSLEKGVVYELRFGKGGPVVHLWLGSSEGNAPAAPQKPTPWWRFW